MKNEIYVPMVGDRPLRDSHGRMRYYHSIKSLERNLPLRIRGCTSVVKYVAEDIYNVKDGAIIKETKGIITT